MELYVEDGVIRVPGKVLNILDKTTIEFVGMIDFDYVIISGYVAILFGRSRTTEDIDLFIERLSKARFGGFYDKLVQNGYYVLNAEDKDDAYSLLKEDFSIRVAKRDMDIFNFELKFPKDVRSEFALRNKWKVVLNDKFELNISPIEMQIAYKLYLGTEKDHYDARHLYDTFKSYLDPARLTYFIKELKVSDETAQRVLYDEYKLK